MRFVVDERGFGVEIAGLAGLEIVYLACKPKDCLSVSGEEPEAEAQAGDDQGQNIV